MEIFYVYGYFDPRKPGKFVYEDLAYSFEPFYIGKGKDKRCFEHLSDTKSKSFQKKSYLHHKINKIIIGITRKIFFNF